MNGFVVFEFPAGAESFLEHPLVTGLCPAECFHRATTQPGVVTFQDLSDDQVTRLQEVVSDLGGEIRPSYQYDPLSA